MIGINDVTGLINVILGVIVCVLEIRTARTCTRDKWLYYLKAAAGAILAVSFGLAVISGFSGGSGLVMPELGRPAVTLALASMMLGAIIQYKRQDCK